MLRQVLFFTLSGCQTFLFANSRAASEPKPNIILFLADDVSWNDFGCYANKEVKTPNIDRLALGGIRFTNFFLTASSCSPSRNSIITGRYPHNTGAAELHTEPPVSMISFAEILRNGGYYTALAGKFHMGKYALRGFDVTLQDGKTNGDGGEQRWVETIQKRPAEKPFFMWFAAYDAHRPWGSNEFSASHDPATINPPFYLANAKNTKEDLARYYDEIARFDHYIGLVVSELKQQKVFDNTVIVIMADNGRPFPHSKTRVNDRGMKAPFIISWPKGISKGGQVCASLVSAIDLAPTFLDIASEKSPETIQGISFKTLLNHPDQTFRNYVFAEHNWHDYEAHERMVRTGDFLYILNSRPRFANTGPADAVGSPSFADLLELNNHGIITPAQADVFLSPRPAEELYHNHSDPDQLKNLAASPEYLDDLQNLRQILKQWMDDTGDDIPQHLTKDWYLRGPKTDKTREFNIRGEMPGENRQATRNNHKGKF